MRAYETAAGTAIFRLQDHTNRLFNSAHIYQIPLPYDRDTLNEAQREVVRANGLASCYLRPLAFYGSEKMGVSPKGAQVHVAIAAWPWGAYLGETALAQGIRVKGVLVRAPARQRHHAARQGGHHVRQFHHRQCRSAAGWLRRGPAARYRGFRGRRRRRNIFIVKDGVLCEPEIAWR